MLPRLLSKCPCRCRTRYEFDIGTCLIRGVSVLHSLLYIVFNMPIIGFREIMK